MKSLTNRQSEVLQAIKRYRDTNGFSPTIREISEYFEVSVKAAYDHIKALEKKGFLRCGTNRSRTLEVIEQHEDEAVQRIPLLGSVAAGRPLFAEENYQGTVPIPQEFLRPGRHFALEVRGDSMKDAGIIDGDLAVIRHQNVAENGDIVVALLDDSVTLKRFFKEKNRIRLQAENPDFPPIYTQEIRVLGKLVHIFREYG